MGFSGIIMRASWDFNGHTIIRYLHPLVVHHFPYQKVPRRGFTPCEEWDLYNGLIIMGLKGVIVRLSWDGRVHVGRASQEQQSFTVLVSMLCLELWRVSRCGFWVLRLSDFDGKTHHETRRMVTQTCPTKKSRHALRQTYPAADLAGTDLLPRRAMETTWCLWANWTTI